jgi:hypothetical protein
MMKYLKMLWVWVSCSVAGLFGPPRYSRTYWDEDATYHGE